MRNVFIGTKSNGEQEGNWFGSLDYSFEEADAEMKSRGYKEYFYVGEYEDNDMPKNDLDLIRHANKEGWFDD